ncbi:triacylglycerol lipase [Marmoricola sp. URHA0025 HA25]
MRRITTLAAALAALLSTALLLPPSASATDVLPVPYQFIPSALLGGMPDADAPGTNDWSCRPSAAHPRPVVLVHGTGGNRSTNWQTYGPLLRNNGYCVFALTYGVTPGSVYPLSAIGGLSSIRSSAAELGAFVDRVLAATGAQQVDLVGHSQGTLMPDYWLKFLGGAGKVGSYISLASLWHGTSTGDIRSLFMLAFGPGVPEYAVPFCAACGEMSASSSFIAEMRSGGVAVPGVHYVNIVSRYDELVVPYTSGIEPGMTNIVLQDRCPLDFTEHFEIAADKNASVLVLNALDPAHPRPLNCVPVLPFVGGL